DLNHHHLLVQRTPTGIGLFRFVGGPTETIAPPFLVPSAPDERIKVRFIGDRLWVLRVVGEHEQVVHDVIEPQFRTATRHGLRIRADGWADGFEVLSREAL
ncbi:MAG: hypothetical protein SNJ79_09210, partial [Sphingomonadaceae bacterium]